MIFVGKGALLKESISYAYFQGYDIDCVFSVNDKLAGFCKNLNLQYVITQGINEKSKMFKSISKDKIVLSINNGQIFRKQLLELKDFRFYNIHNGLIPKYRGLPEVCITYAILNGESEYGVSLHEIDDGIDTGKCLDVMRFPLKKSDSFQTVMLKSITCCNDIFCKNLKSIVNNGPFKEMVVNSKESRLYTYKDLDRINRFRFHQDIKRAVNYGVFKLWFSKAHSIVKEQLTNK